MITEKDIVDVKIIGFSHPKNWYAKYAGTDKIFRAVLGKLKDGTPIYQTFFEGLLSRVNGDWWTYEDCLHANYIFLENAEIVNQGNEGQDRQNYTDEQDRESYAVNE